MCGDGHRRSGKQDGVVFGGGVGPPPFGCAGMGWRSGAGEARRHSRRAGRAGRGKEGGTAGGREFGRREVPPPLARATTKVAIHARPLPEVPDSATNCRQRKRGPTGPKKGQAEERAKQRRNRGGQTGKGAPACSCAQCTGEHQRAHHRCGLSLTHHQCDCVCVFCVGPAVAPPGRWRPRPVATGTWSAAIWPPVVAPPGW